jgi:hypothetical protein
MYKTDKPVEPNIKALVDALNTVESVLTIASCQGHVFPCRSPYVMFRADVEFAAELAKKLHADLMADTRSRLRAYWEISGSFNDDFDLCFTLYSPEYHRNLGKLVCRAFQEKLLAQDFAVLTDMVNRVGNRESNREKENG